MSGELRESQSTTIRVRTGCGNLYATIVFDDGETEDARKMVGLLSKLGKSGGCLSAMLEVISSLVTEALRAGADPAVLVKCLQGIQCHQSNQAAGIPSCADAVATAIKRGAKVE